jgi:4-amino-4-deoxy-L-arabinose transferase-like glycosyltransferase
VRTSLALLLIGTAVLYIAGLSASGWANSFYSAAAQAGSTDWTAFFYGSLDGANSITVDKPPAAMWIMSLSVRLFGLSSWSILVPQALMGVGAVAITYFTIRRVLGHGTRSAGRVRPVSVGATASPATAHWAALFGAAAFALTPVATLMFRFNNPDALLVLLLTAASYCVVRAIEHASRRWLVLAGVLVGFGFLTKMLQAFIVLPAFVAVYAIAAPATWRKKIVDLLSAFAAMLLSLGWYVAVVELVPASWRPYIGGSQTDSLLELVFGYNGFGRITGNQVGSVGGGQGGGWGTTGITRMFEGVSGGMVSWLIPAALVLTVCALVVLGRAGMANLRGRGTSPATLAAGGLIILTGSLVITALVFSFMAGIYHDYYTVALAPAIGGAVGVGGAVLWTARSTLVARIGLAVTAVLTGGWAFTLTLSAGNAWIGLGIAVAAVSVAGAVLLLASKRLAAIAVAGAAIAALAGPAAYSVDTALTPHTGSIVTAGPVSGNAGPGGGRPGGTDGDGRPGQVPRDGSGQNRQGAGDRQDGFDGGAPPKDAQDGNPPGTQAQPGSQTGRGQGSQGGMGGLLDGADVSDEMISALQRDASDYTWVAATVGSQNAASYQLATQLPVMAIGGFNGSDPSPTLAEFCELVAQGRIHYFIAGGVGGRQNGGSDAAAQITSWVESTFTSTTIGQTTVYDVSGA